ncbi:hypothetical protein CI109_102351 [Kwoniella shandongensis]|uniref:CENP-V/GFA domain-containing protein n=1 Tax=Kwoniella shandongensis TaxID=1734106 RepID=A0AAJ8MWQ7_9TREE
MTYTGSCLCGACQVVVNSTEDKQTACHCVDCQHTSGTAYSSNILPKQSDVKITGAVKEYGSKAASGNTVTRVFCGECGSPLAHKSKAFGDAMAVQTGNLPDFRKVPYGAELFVKDRWTGLQPIPEADQVQIM